MSGYAAKESVLCCLLHTSANVETRDGGWGLLELIVWSSVVRFFLLVEEGGWVGVSSSCCFGTRDTSRKPGPHSM